MMTPPAPRFARWLLKQCARGYRDTFVVGDLDEAFITRARVHLPSARRWYRRQALLTSLILLRTRLSRVIWDRKAPSTRQKEKHVMLLDNLVSDIRHGVRGLRRNPLFSISAIATLAVGIGGTVALFSVIDAVLLEPPAYDSPERVVNLYETRESQPNRLSNMSYPDVIDIRERTSTLSVVAARQGWDPTLLGVGDPIRLNGSSVSANFFSAFGVKPALGRLFDEGDGAPGHTPVVVLSHSFWVQRFGARADVIGTALDLRGTSYEVIGVAPEGFEDTDGPEMIWRADPPHFDVNVLTRTGHSFRPVARIAPGRTLREVNAELQQINADLVRSFPEKTGDHLVAIPVMQVLVGESPAAIVLLFAAVSMLLVIACANIANLLLSRATARRREMAVRAALGAGPRRLSAQLLTESLMLALLGGGVGVLLASVLVPIFVRMSSAIPRADRITLDPSVLLFALVITVVVGIAFGLAPVWLLRRRSQLLDLRDGQRSVDGLGGWTLRNVLVVGELAVSVLLLTSAGLLVRSFLNLQRVDKGVRTEHVLTMNIVPSGVNWPGHGDITRYWEQVIERVDALPGVRNSGAVSFLPMSGGYEGQGIWRTDQPRPEPGQYSSVEARAVTPGYFDAIGINVVRGRGFTRADDSAAAAVIVINQTLADQLFPGEDPIGKFIQVQLEQPHEVVGVVSDTRQFGVQAPVRPEIYAPHAQRFVSWIRRSMDLVVHTEIEPAAVATSVQESVWSIDATAPIANVKTMERWVAEDVSAPRFRTVLLSTFSIAALLLAAVGIAGVLSYTVSRRTAEFGIRTALGASRADVVQMVLRQGGGLIAIGSTIGLLSSILVAHVLDSFLFEVTRIDPVTLLSVTIGVLLVSLVAMLIPATRASRISPMVALRD